MTFIPDVAGTLQSSGKAAGSATQQDAESDLVIATNAEGADGFTLTKSNLSKTVNNQTPLVVACFDPTQITHPENRSEARKTDRGVRVVSSPPSGVRRLTPRECERLQGFPDDWTLISIGKKKKKLAKDGPRYAALGNSMAVPVMRWIGRRIALVDSILRGDHGL